MKHSQRLSVIALLATMSFVLMLVGQVVLIPTASFLKLDLSFLPIFLGAVLMDLRAGYGILCLRSLLKLLLDGGGPAGYIGLPMNIVAMGLLLTALIWALNRKAEWSVSALVKGGTIGTLAMTASMVLLNWIYAIPLYALLANFDIAKTIGLEHYLLWMVVPFNLLEGLILTILVGCMLFPFKNIILRLRRQVN
ncbi:ECF transporter S component [Weissella halotolerans]|uniref:Riboflavin transporter n=1 Tax=Weissella halotolerans DSM 20190 TaxID=1123500 RepID=A0A0R2G9L5_9LACO|nr:ECF transporter S component [Weissella halotolerans]KRN33380.1 hypothetical protein IV68_GL000178 [Weissella halotolerans DSM 20190]